MIYYIILYDCRGFFALEEKIFLIIVFIFYKTEKIIMAKIEDILQSLRNHFDSKQRKIDMSM